VAGPYKITSEGAFGSPGLHVYRPEALDAFPKKDTLPVMVWGNGGCGIDSTRYSGFLTTIASHGFLVMGTVPQSGAARRQESADDVRAAIDWAAKENARADSPLKGKIAVDKVAVMGQSCGGFLSIELGADPRVKTIGVFNSGCKTRRPPRRAKERGAARRNRRRTLCPNCTGPCC
jgi:predicted alpha/beta hydrolase